MITTVCSTGGSGGDELEPGVIDNGPGILERIRSEVCELFFSRRDGGSGTGLASVKRTTEMHGGRVKIGDAPPTGAGVRMVFPQKKGRT